MTDTKKEHMTQDVTQICGTPSFEQKAAEVFSNWYHDNQRDPITLMANALHEVHNAAIEEAAKYLDRYYSPDAGYVAGKIRELKVKE